MPTGDPMPHNNPFAPDADGDTGFCPVGTVLSIGHAFPGVSSKRTYNELLRAMQNGYDEYNGTEYPETTPLGRAYAYGRTVRTAVTRIMLDPPPNLTACASPPDEAGWCRFPPVRRPHGIMGRYEAKFPDGHRFMVLVDFRLDPVDTDDGTSRWTVTESWQYLEENDALPDGVYEHELRVNQQVDHLQYDSERDGAAAMLLHALVDQRYQLPPLDEIFDLFVENDDVLE
jgi:hypothetical protein